jgi:hypothetical protein
MTVTANKPAPYAPASVVLDLIHRHRTRGLPPPIFGDVLGRSGVAETLIPRTLQSIQALDLVDAKTGMPTPTFEAIRLAPEAEYKKALENWLKGTYADVFAFVDPTKDDETRVRDAFRNYQPIGQQGRMVTLFLALCTAAGLIPEKSASAATQRSAPSRSAATRPRPQNVTTLRNLATLSGAQNRGIANTPEIPAPLAGLLAKLPPEGHGWTKESRQKFLATFETVLDFCFPVVKATPENENGGQT